MKVKIKDETTTSYFFKTPTEGGEQARPSQNDDGIVYFTKT